MTDRFFTSYRGPRRRLPQALPRVSGTPLVLQGETLAFPAEAALVGKLVRRVFGTDTELARVVTMPAERVKGVGRTILADEDAAPRVAQRARGAPA